MKSTRTPVFPRWLLLACAASLVGVPQTASGDERILYVSALDASGHPVKDLTVGDFVIRENGVAREVLRVRQPVETPMHIALLIDNSQAAEPNLRDVRDALKQFISEMTPKNFVAIITYGERPTIVVDYTNNAATLSKGVDRIVAHSGSGAYLLESIIEVSRGVKRREASRPAIVAVTARGVEFSNQHYTQVLEVLRESGAALHVLDFEPGHVTGELDAVRNRGIVLDEGSRTTGGRHDTILTSMAFLPKLREIAAELAHQYEVTYSRPASLIPPTQIDVKITRPGVIARGTPVRPRKNP